MKSNETIQEYNIAKGIIIIFVILGHSYYIGSHGTTMADYISTDSNCVISFFYTYIDKIIYSFHMPIYMIISGALACKRLDDCNIGGYVRNRFERLIIPFFLCEILYAVPIKYIAGFYYDWSLLKAYLYSTVLMQTPAHLWFLVILFLLSITFSVLAKYKLLDNKFVLVCISLLYLGHDYLPGGGYFLYKYGQFAIYFYIGIMIEKNKVRARINHLLGHKSIQSIFISILLYSVVLILDINIMPIIAIPKAPFRNGFRFAEAIIGCLIIYLLCHYIKDTEHPIIDYLSRNSFGIYLYHEPIIHMCIYLFILTGFVNRLTDPYMYLLSIAIRFMSALVVALIVNAAIKIVKQIVLKKAVRG